MVKRYGEEASAVPRWRAVVPRPVLSPVVPQSHAQPADLQERGGSRHRRGLSRCDAVERDGTVPVECGIATIDCCCQRAGEIMN